MGFWRRVVRPTGFEPEAYRVGVTRESLNSYVTTMFNDGQIHIAKWVRNALDLNDGDELLFEVVDNKIIFTKAEG